jgi:hypothetical protein
VAKGADDVASRRTSLSPEEGAELKRLYEELEPATKRVNVVLRKSGITSEAFVNADREVTRILQRIKKIHDLVGKPKRRWAWNDGS